MRRKNFSRQNMRPQQGPDLKNNFGKIFAPLHPAVHTVFFLSIAALGVFAGLRQETAAYAACMYFLIVAVLHPLNGLYFIILAAPFFLGNSKRPFFNVLEFFVYTGLLSGIAHYFIRKPALKPAKCFLPVLIFAAVSILSIPLNIKEVIWDIRIWPAAENARAVLSSHEGSNLYYFRVLLNTLSGIGFFFMSAAFLKSKDDVTRLFKPLLFMLFINSVFGYLFLYGIIPTGGSYLSLSLVGRHTIGDYGPGMTAFAYHRGYLSQYLSIFYPIAGYFIFQRGKGTLARLPGILLLLLVFTAMPLTYQRASLIVIPAQFLVFLLLTLRMFGKRRPHPKIMLPALFCLAGVFYLVDYAILGGGGISRLADVGSGRENQFRVAAAMFAGHPLLGIGQGRFHLFFEKYCEALNIPYTHHLSLFRTTAHNVYLHTLAEQGILGLGSLLSVILVFYADVFRRIKTLDEDRQKVLAVLTVCLTGWVFYGLTQHTFYIRSIQIIFWVLLGFIYVILKEFLPGLRLSRKSAAIFLMVFAALLAFRINTASRYPYPQRYLSGFYRMETQPEGRTARWIGQRAVMRLPSGQGGVAIGLKCPTPAVVSRPQKVRVTLNGSEKTAVLENTEYAEVVFPAEAAGGEYIWIKFQTAYTVNPAGEGWFDDRRNLGVMVYEPVWGDF